MNKHKRFVKQFYDKALFLDQRDWDVTETSVQMALLFTILSLFPFLFMAAAAPQLPEINDQYDTTKPETVGHINKSKPLYISEEYDIKDKKVTYENDVPKFKITFYRILTEPFAKLITEPKVVMVLRNIGTCIVNGVMEIISYYFPAPFMPLIATAAGMLIPFEPVVTLRRRMPVTSYRRAFKTAVNSFLNTFDEYKVDDDDPYMTRRFNRRFLNNISEEKRKH